MIAQEERIYDDYFLKRLSPDQARSIIDNDRWPGDFLTYENVLKIGVASGKACRFVDPLSPALIETVRDLRSTRSDITTTEMATLLGIDVDHARALIASI